MRRQEVEEKKENDEDGEMESYKFCIKERRQERKGLGWGH